MTIVNISNASKLGFVFGISRLLKSRNLLLIRSYDSGSWLKYWNSFSYCKTGCLAIGVLSSGPASATRYYIGFRLIGIGDLRSLVAWNECRHLDSCGFGVVGPDATFLVAGKDELINGHKKSCSIGSG